MAGTALSDSETEATTKALPDRSIGSNADAVRRYGGSLWNAWLDLKLAADLTIEEHRLADALARNMIGFGGRTSERLGNVLLRSESRLHGRSFERARDGLAEKGLIRFEKGRGRGARTLYVLLVEKAAEARSYLDSPKEEKTAEQRPLPAIRPQKRPLKRPLLSGHGVRTPEREIRR
ncbi:MAG TPA: hypothetical protein VFA56_13625 [Gaiellaceae bacterium]|nr:hypothetical protein [Gaiellaceae bacterium]